MHHDTPPHIYTQEEAVALNNTVSELKCSVRKEELKSNNLKEKLDLALSLMEKEQLIEFINKII